MNGLRRHTYGWILEMELEDPEEIYNYLKNLESKILAKRKEYECRRKTNETELNEDKMNNNEINTSIREFRNNYGQETVEINNISKNILKDKSNYKNDNIKDQKYCKLHKNGNHTTEECRLYDKDYYKKLNVA
jgi:hypothetical protein